MGSMRKTKTVDLLVVDDEKEVCDFLRGFFEERGYAVHTSGSREEAMSLIEKLEPQIVLLDIRLRGGKERHDGMEMLAEVKKRYPAILVMMITGLDNEELAKEATRLGADDYITKPLSLEYLETAVVRKVQARPAD